MRKSTGTSTTFRGGEAAFADSLTIENSVIPDYAVYESNELPDDVFKACVYNGGTLTADGTVRLKSGTLDNRGEFSAGMLVLSGEGAVFSNTGAVKTNTFQSNEGTSFTNTGTISAEIFYLSGELENEGTLEGSGDIATLTLNGTLTLAGGSSLANLTVAVESGSSLIFEDGSSAEGTKLNIAGGSVSASGSVSIEEIAVSSGSLTGTDGTLTVGSLSTTGGTVSLADAEIANLTVGSNAEVTVAGSLSLKGGSVTNGSAAAGVLDISGDVSVIRTAP